MAQHKGAIPYNKTNWTTEMIQFLKDNYCAMTNSELSKALGLRLTVTRNKLAELNLKRMELEYWTPEMVLFLKLSYKKIGDVEIMEFFKNNFPKLKGWKRNAIWKKRNHLNLLRTEAQKRKIIARHYLPGGRQLTIYKNSSSINMHPTWVAQRIAWRNKELQQELLKHPEIIDAARQLILLSRKIKLHEK